MRGVEKLAPPGARYAVTAKVQRQTGGVLVDPAELESLHRMQALFVAIVKEQGRVRVSEATIESLKPQDRVTSKKDASAIILSYEPAEPEEASPTP